MKKKLSIFIALLATFAFVVLPSFAAPQAETITVNTTLDEYDNPANGSCSLREAVQTANDGAPFGGCAVGTIDPGEDVTISLSADTYLLTIAGAGENDNATGDLDLQAPNVAITGAGAGSTVIQANFSNRSSGADSDRLFHIQSGVVTIQSLTIRDGSVIDEFGGGVLNAGDLTMTSVTLTNNEAPNGAGGAIETSSGATTTLNTVTLSNNRAGINGGGMHVSGTGNSSINGGQVSDNIATAEGGGLWNGSGTMTIDGTSFSGNVANGTDMSQGGGALFNIGGTMVVRNATIDNNSADGASGSGGGILNDGGTLTVSDTAFSNNSANRAGGGIEDDARNSGVTTVTLTSVDFMTNTVGSAPGNGGALHVSGAGTVAATGGMVIGNTAAAEGGGFWNGSGTMTVDGTSFTGNVASGAEANNGGGGLFNAGGTLEISNATITGNSADGASGSGGGILNDMGTLTVSDSSIDTNSASRAGGGIEDVGVASSARAASTTLTNVDFDGNDTGSNPGNGGALHVTGPGMVMATGGDVTNNTAAREGGGFWNFSSATMIVDGTSFSGNVASGPAADDGGGALFNSGGTMTVSNVAISENSADGMAGSGGGIFSLAGALTVNGTTLIDNNDAVRAGGGIEVVDGTATINGVTFTNNFAGSAPGNGGAIHVTGATAAITVTGGMANNNLAAAEGGGFWNNGGTMSVDGTSFANNVASGADADNGGGALFNNGGTMTLANITVANNSADGASGSGGGILNDDGVLIVSNSSLSGNSASRAGGGIEDVDKVPARGVDSTTLINVVFTSNSTGSSPGNGGALHVTGPGIVNITGGSAVSNTATSEGGGFWNFGSATMSISGTAFTGNVASGAEATNGGGALFNLGTMTLVNITVENNSADGASGSGGGLLNDGGTVTITDAAFSGNTAMRAGGAVEDVAGTQMWTRVTATNNSTGSSPGNGGALHISDAGNVTVALSTIRDNSAAAEGGGLWNSAAGTLTVDKSLLAGNSANGTADGSLGGGALFNLGAMTVSNSTLSGNTAQEGGGIFNDGAAAEASVINVTIYENSGTAGAGGVANTTGGALTLANSIVAHVAATPVRATGPDCAGVITTNGANLDSDGTCADANSGNPLLGDLDDNGGATLTHALLEDSPAIDAGNNAICSAAPINNVDQRDEARDADTSCDLGAYEYAGSTAVTLRNLTASSSQSAVLLAALLITFGTAGLWVRRIRG